MLYGKLACVPNDADLLALGTNVKVAVGASNGGGAFQETSYVYDNVTIEGE